MYGDIGANSHDFVSEFVELPGPHEPFDYTHETILGHESTEPKTGEMNLQELFYSPMMSAAAGSAEPTPLMTPNDHTFAMPPSYFSPSLSPGLPAGEMPEFELPKKAAQPTGSRVAKKPTRRKWAVSRAGSISSGGGQSRHNSSASPSTNSDENEPETEDGAPAATPASLMNVSSILPQSLEMEQRLDQALQATQANSTTSSTNSNPAQYYTPTIRPRRTPSMHSRSVTSSPRLGPYLSPALAPADVDELMPKPNYTQYPERLAADMSSKKASHKIAEQERRNRINVAINELGRMVAPDAPMTSKAATVEAAIGYIKGLHEEIRVLKERLQE